MKDFSDPSFVRARREGQFIVRPCEHLLVKRTNDVVQSEFIADYILADGSQGDKTTYTVDSDVSALNLLGWADTAGFWESNPGTVATWFVDHPDPYGSEYRRNQVLGAAYAQAGKADMQTLVSYAEFEKTCESAKRLVTIMPRMIKWFQTHKRTLFVRGELFRATGDLARQWLEYRYGFMQLYYDYHSLVTALTRKSGNFRACHASWNGVRTSDGYPMPNRSQGPHFDQEGRLVGTRSVNIRAGVVVRCDPVVDFVRSWGLSQPLGTCWELVPFSFMVDWFLGVSDALAAFEGRFTQDVVSSWVSERTQSRLEWRFRLIPKVTWNGGPTYIGRGGLDVRTYEDIVHYVRVANPTLHLTLPQWRINLNWKRFVDLSAFLRQLMRNV